MGMLSELHGLLALQVWPEVVGPRIASVTRAERLSEGILFVKTASSVWANELTFQKPLLVEQLNGKLGRPMVSDIRFRAGRLHPAPSSTLKEHSKALEEVRLSPSDLEQIERTVVNLKDKALREALRSLLTKERKRIRREEQKGSRSCQVCGCLGEAGGLCSFCERKKAEEEEDSHRRIRRWFSLSPWGSEDSLFSEIPEASLEKIREIREGLLGDYSQSVSRLSRKYPRTTRTGSAPTVKTLPILDRDAILTYVMLKTRVPPDRLTADTITTALGPEMAHLASLIS